MRINVVFILFITFIIFGCIPNNKRNESKRREELSNLLKRLPTDLKHNYFVEYLEHTGELPPDFDAMKSQFFLPDPLVWTKNRKDASVKKSEWAQRRQQLKELAEQWLLGTAPPAPGNVEAEILSKENDGKFEVWKVQLRFGPDHAAKLSVTLYLPLERHQQIPVFLCDGDRYLPWAKKAMDEGFGFAIHGARDGERDESWLYADMYGDYDWSSFRRRGWSASRVVDWLVTLPFIDSENIYIGGHSRSAKQATVAAAFDERIAGVIASSPGSGGGSMPYRFCDQSYFGESAEILTRRFADWVHPRVRMFSGREEKLPTDSHILYALIAPRPLLMSTATEDAVENRWSVEQVYNLIKKVYALLDAEHNLVLRYRSGLHTIKDKETFIAFSDFLLTAAKGGMSLDTLFPFEPLYPWDYEQWLENNQRIDPMAFEASHASNPIATSDSTTISFDEWLVRRKQIQNKIIWLLGEGPAYSRCAVSYSEGESEELASNLERYTVADQIKKSTVRSVLETTPQIQIKPVSFGSDINGYFYDNESNDSLPLVIWLGPFQTPRGFVASVYRSGTSTPATFMKAGIPLLAYDHIGTGARINDRKEFYKVHPKWSLMGKMVQDAQHAIDAAEWLSGNKDRKIFLYGYAMGATVALLTASLDDRVDGIISIAGFTPMRSDFDNRHTGGIRRYSHLFGWLPRLGFFIQNESRIPIDFNEVLASIAPRQALIIAPELDRYATFDDVIGAVNYAQYAYEFFDLKSNLELQTPYDENRLTELMQVSVIEWLFKNAVMQ